MKGFHLRLPETTYALLKAAAERAQVPATILAREAIDSWLRDQARKRRHDSIAAFAAELAGTELDLDRELESAGIGHLLKSVSLKISSGRTPILFVSFGRSRVVT